MTDTNAGADAMMLAVTDERPRGWRHPNLPHFDGPPTPFKVAAPSAYDGRERIITQFVVALDGETTAHTAPKAKPLRTNEQNEVLGIFMDMLAGPTGDGGNKRAAGTKPSWKVDDHFDRGAGHVLRWRNGEQVDKDSGCHPLIHAAWRFLAEAWQEDEAAGRHTNGEPA